MGRAIVEPDSVLALGASGKYSRAPGMGLAVRLDQSSRACDYRPALPALPGLRRDFPVTARRFP